MNPPDRPRLAPDSDLPAIARAIERAGGRLLVVGGFVRDGLCGKTSHDLDLEVFGLEPDAVEGAIAGFGFSPRVGRQRPVWRRVRDGVDLATPRAAARLIPAVGSGPGTESSPPGLDEAFREAARDRDLTVNAIGWDPLSDRIVDPLRALDDLSRRRLAAVDLSTFGDDPLRLLRVARLQSALEASVDPALVSLCRSLDLSAVAAERIGGELLRLLVDLAAPSRAFGWLHAIGRLDVFPPVAALVGVEQDPIWHPEGDVFVHTLLVLDRARELALALDSDAREILMLAALCHDLGKPGTTRREGSRVRSIAHELASAREARAWLVRLRFAERVVRAVEGLALFHLAPVQFPNGNAGPRAYRRLARKAAAYGCSLEQLERLARADQLGRTTEAARSGRFEAGERFLEAAERAAVRVAPVADVVQARHLLQRGIAAGPELGRLLRRCREIEDATGWQDPEQVVDRCLGRRGARRALGDDAPD